MKLTNSELKTLLTDFEAMTVETGEDHITRTCHEIDLAPDCYIYFESLVVSGPPECWIDRDNHLQFKCKHIYFEMVSIMWEGDDISTDENKKYLENFLSEKVMV